MLAVVFVNLSFGQHTLADGDGSMPGMHRSVGDVCMTNFECSGGQSCVSGICRCANNQLIANGRCIPNNGLCNNGDQVYFDGKCYKSVEIGDPCVISYQCQGGSSCFNGTCICPTGSNSSNGRCIQANGNCSDNQILIQDRCYTLAQIGQYCTISAQCLGGSLCTNYQCKCPEGTAQNGEVCRPAVSPVTCPNGQVSMNGMCVQRVAPGQPCQGNAQCLDGSSCVNSYCICPEGMNNINGYCRKLSFTDHCNEAISIELNGRCASVQKPGGYCQRSEQCLGGSICTNGYCSCPSTSTLFNGYCVHSGKCPENQVDSNGRCYQRSYIGGYCMISEQCMGGSECTYAALCQCPYGTQVFDLKFVASLPLTFKWTQQNVVVELLMRSLLHHYCTSYLARKEVDGNCRRIKGTNICLDEEVLVNDTCVERVIPGQNCNHTEQCLGDSSCLNSVCVCPPGTQLLESYCVPLKRSLFCNETEMELNGECLKYARPGHNCTDNLQCLASSTCPTGVCECSYGYTNVMGYCIIIGIGRAPRECRNSEILINDHCFNKAYIGQYCIYTKQCQGGSSCINSYCACASGSTIQGSRCLTDTNSCEVNQVKVNGQCYNTSEIGQLCQIAPQCLGGSICASNICVCPQGTHQESAMCVRDANTCSAEQVSINGQCYKKVC
ncbi:unnamed protein product [Toxocara canis]|uniref:Prion-like-(Q/N-rich) domain-bearing protein 25 n=1 Tax=Toxocara canis TaxID=6265 RepID=A0A183V1G1_TOXCA|nr:unnamed protein product [Toxocara canis]